MRAGYWFMVMTGLILLGHVAGRGVEAQSQRQHDAHVHGAGTLNLVQEGNQVHIELEIPGMDIVGFEHQATTASQKQAVQQAVAALEQGSSLFHINESAKCTFDKAAVDMEMMGEAHEEKHDQHDHDKDQHGEDKDSDHHDHEKKGAAHKDEEHDHEKQGAAHKDEEAHHKDKPHAEDAEERHSEFHAQYIFTCASPDNLKQVKVTLFDQFKNSESLQAQFVTARKQSAQRISREAPTIGLD